MNKLEVAEKKIGKVDVRVTQFGAFQQAELGDRLTILFAPFAGKLKGFDLNSDIGDLGPAFEAVLRNISPGEASQLRLDLVAGTQAKLGDRWVHLNGPDTINAVFGGDLKSFWQTVLFAAQVNFGPLFDGAQTAISAMRAGLKQKEEPSRSTQDG